LAIFRRMRAEGVPQDHISYTSAITACEKVLKQAPTFPCRSARERVGLLYI
jgi:hypothetical protein